MLIPDIALSSQTLQLLIEQSWRMLHAEALEICKIVKTSYIVPDFAFTVLLKFLQGKQVLASKN